MKGKTVSLISLAVLIVIGIAALFMSWYGQSVSWQFLLTFYPLLLILVGVAFLGQGGLRMAFAGLILTILLAVLRFDTPIEVVLGASAYGFIKSFGISVSVAATMLMIFLMRETGALGTVSEVIKHQVVGNEVQALYIGIGFGSLLSALGVVTPALFPPLLVTMGFTPAAAIAIAVLGYDATTSFSLLSIPITLPASVGGLMELQFAFKIAIFLPLVSTGFAFAILWATGGRESMRRGVIPAVISGLALAFACLGAVSLDYFTGVAYVPLRIVGVLAGMLAMIALYAYQRLGSHRIQGQKAQNYPSRKEIWRSFSPWIILAVFATVASIQQIGDWLANALESLEVVKIFADKTVDLDILYQPYTWILLAILFSLYTLRPTSGQIKKAVSVWGKRFVGPFLAYSLYFCIAFVMAWSAMRIENGVLTKSALYDTLNMNVILGLTLASIFGAGYIFVAASLGLFGAIVGGSETSSNVLFLGIQKTAAKTIGLSDSGFMTVYGSHAVGGGIASAVTPAKINNAVVTIDESHKTESLIMRNHLVIALLLTIATGVLTGIFVSVGI